MYKNILFCFFRLLKKKNILISRKPTFIPKRVRPNYGLGHLSVAIQCCSKIYTVVFAVASFVDSRFFNRPYILWASWIKCISFLQFLTNLVKQVLSYICPLYILSYICPLYSLCFCMTACAELLDAQDAPIILPLVLYFLVRATFCTLSSSKPHQNARPSSFLF